MAKTPLKAAHAPLAMATMSHVDDLVGCCWGVCPETDDGMAGRQAGERRGTENEWEEEIEEMGA